MKLLKSLFNIARNTGVDKADIPEVTNYLKNNETFKKNAMKLHNNKENIKSKFWSKIDSMLQEEDNLKFIEDKSDKSKNK